jgi:drug/metabolite transporter (DMT)-like permease
MESTRRGERCGLLKDVTNGHAMENPVAVIFALAAAGLYGLGNALEHRVVTDTAPDSRRSDSRRPDSRVDVGLLRRLARQPLWLLGMFGDVGAYGFQAAALAFGGLLLVAPLLACGLLVALPLSARWTGRGIRKREWIAAVVLCASLATFLIEAAPSGGVAHASAADWARVGGTVGLLVVGAVVIAVRTRGPVRAACLGFAAGGLFGITAALTKTFVDQIQHGVPYTASHWEVYALAVFSIVGILFTQHGFQASALSASLPALEATEPVVAASVGVALLHEHLNGQSASANALIAVAIVAALACIVILAREAGRVAGAPADPVVPAPVRRAERTTHRPRLAYVPNESRAANGRRGARRSARWRRGRVAHGSSARTGPE